MRNLKEADKDIKLLLSIKDPIVKVSDEEITFYPNYLNYSFISNFFPILILLYIISGIHETIEIIICLAPILISIIIILIQLRNYNTIRINFTEKIIYITPHFFYKRRRTKCKIRFEEIQEINFTYTGFWLAYRRYFIKVKLDNFQQIKLINTKDEESATKIVSILSKILQHQE